MKFELWYLLLGALLIAIALISSVVKRLPLTTTMLYLGVGVLLGPLGIQVARIDPLFRAGLLERLAELAVIVSLFTAGLKLRIPLRDRNWIVPFRLAFLSMGLTVGLIAAVGVWGLGLPLGAAILLGANLAPTDPVLASEVQLESATDRDKLRFSLTGEAGFNDGTAFPFVMLGLGLLGLHELGEWGWRWLTVDVLWAIGGGLGIGATLGTLLGQLVLYLRRVHKEAFGLDEFLALGVIGLSYGVALFAHSYGFLAVFAAGLALRGVERNHTGTKASKTAVRAPASAMQEAATQPHKAPVHMVEAVLRFNEQVERILEVALVLIIGVMVAPKYLTTTSLWFVAVLLFVIRPLTVMLGLARVQVDRGQRAMLCWFGIRGIGSIYYLMHAVGKGLPDSLAQELISFTLCAIVASVVLHGISVTPLMQGYQGRMKLFRNRREAAP